MPWSYTGRRGIPRNNFSWSMDWTVSLMCLQDMTVMESSETCVVCMAIYHGLMCPSWTRRLFTMMMMMRVNAVDEREDSNTQTWSSVNAADRQMPNYISASMATTPIRRRLKFELALVNFVHCPGTKLSWAVLFTYSHLRFGRPMVIWHWAAAYWETLISNLLLQFYACVRIWSCYSFEYFADKSKEEAVIFTNVYFCCAEHDREARYSFNKLQKIDIIANFRMHMSETIYTYNLASTRRSQWQLSVREMKHRKKVWEKHDVSKCLDPVHLLFLLMGAFSVYIRA